MPAHDVRSSSYYRVQVAVLAALIEQLLQEELHHQITKFHALKPSKPQLYIYERKSMNSFVGHKLQLRPISSE